MAAKGIKRKRGEEDPLALHVKSCLFTRGLYTDVISLIFSYAYCIRFQVNQQPSRQIAVPNDRILSMTVYGRELFLVDNHLHLIFVFEVTDGAFLRKLETKPMLTFPRSVHVTHDLLVVEGSNNYNHFTVWKKDFSQVVAVINCPSPRGDNRYSYFATNHNRLTLLDHNQLVPAVRNYNLTNGLDTGPWTRVPREWESITWQHSNQPMHQSRYYIDPFVAEDENKICFVPGTLPIVATMSSLDLSGVSLHRVHLSPRHLIMHVVIYGSQFVMLTRSGYDSYCVVACDRESGELSCEPLKLGHMPLKLQVVDISPSPIVLVHQYARPIQVFE